jgi:hypothetical protein
MMFRLHLDGLQLQAMTIHFMDAPASLISGGGLS